MLADDVGQSFSFRMCIWDCVQTVAINLNIMVYWCVCILLLVVFIR